MLYFHGLQNQNKLNFEKCLFSSINLIVPNAPFLYPQGTSGNRNIRFSDVSKR